MSRNAVRPPPWLLLAALALAGLFLLDRYFTPAYLLERQLWLCRASGYTALALLAAAVLATPLSRGLSWLAVSRVAQRAKVWRRQCGVASFLLALAHAWIAWESFVPESWGLILSTPYLCFGLIALAVLAALFATSFKWANRLLRLSLWKELHRLSYVALVAVCYHLLLSPFASRWWTLVLFAGLAVLMPLRWLPARSRNAN